MGGGSFLLSLTEDTEINRRVELLLSLGSFGLFSVFTERLFSHRLKFQCVR